jgi:hypothetical protein
MTPGVRADGAGVNVAFGRDCVMEPWCGVCCDYMMEVAHIGLHVLEHIELASTHLT